MYSGAADQQVQTKSELTASSSVTTMNGAMPYCRLNFVDAPMLVDTTIKSR